MTCRHGEYRLAIRGRDSVLTIQRPEHAAVPVGQRVTFDGGRSGIHEGAGWVRVFGQGENFKTV